MKLALIGTGNVAFHLSKAFDSKENEFYLFGQNSKAALDLSKGLQNALHHPDLDFTNIDLDFCFILVSDDAIKQVAEKIKLPQKAILLHSSGSQPLDLLTAYHKKVGIFYPLQTFSKARKVNFEEVPIGVHSNSLENYKKIEALARAVSPKVYHWDDTTRLRIHLSAVFANNFTNALLTISKSLVPENIDTKVIDPLIKETYQKALESLPENSQTGPAKRGDLKVLVAHTSLLKEKDVDLLDLYLKISKIINPELKDLL